MNKSFHNGKIADFKQKLPKKLLHFRFLWSVKAAKKRTKASKTVNIGNFKQKLLQKSPALSVPFGWKRNKKRTKVFKTVNIGNFK